MNKDHKELLGQVTLEFVYQPVLVFKDETVASKVRAE